MPDLLIDEIEDWVIETLQKRAAKRGQNLEEYARTVLAEAAKEHQAHRAALDQIRDGQPPQSSDSTSMIRALRDDRESELDSQGAAVA